MTFREAMREIESHEFAARLNVASDFRTFLRAAQQQEAVHTLLRELDSLEKRQEVLFRTLELSRQRVDFRYENQWDTALAVYVWLIHLKDFDLAKVVAEAAAQAPQCWWALKFSRHILLETSTHNDASVEWRETILSPIPAKATPTSDSGEAIVYASFLLAMTKMPIVQADVSIGLGLQTSTSASEWSLQPSGYEVPDIEQVASPFFEIALPLGGSSSRNAFFGAKFPTFHPILRIEVHKEENRVVG